MLTLVFAKQELLGEEQRREKPSDSAGGSKVALKVLVNLLARKGS